MCCLKRFSGRAAKLDRFVDFPLEGLDLAPYVAHGGDGFVYDLFAVTNHFGMAGYGHYTAFARDVFGEGEPGPWLRCDDSSVSEADPGEVRSKAAYVLFYARRDPPVDEAANPAVDDDAAGARPFRPLA